MANLAKALGSASSAAVFGTTDTGGPTIVSIGDLPNLRCLIMPVRVGEQDIPFVPEWLVPLEPVEDSQKTVAEKVADAA